MTAAEKLTRLAGLVAKYTPQVREELRTQTAAMAAIAEYRATISNNPFVHLEDVVYHEAKRRALAELAERGNHGKGE